MSENVKRGVKRGTRRGPYHRSNEDMRRRVIEAADRGEDWKVIAVANGVKEMTAYRWIRTGRVEKKARGGLQRNTKKLEEVHVEFLLEKLSENSLLTLREMAELLSETHHITVSTHTISRCLDCHLFTLKKVRYEPETMNTTANKEKRKEYTQRIMHLMGEIKHIIYADEANVNLFLRRSFGRAPRGQRATVKMPSSRGANVHMIGAISQLGLEKFKTQRGSFRSEQFNTWLTELMDEVISNGTPANSIVIVIDNAPCHSRAESVISEYSGSILLRLPPYSPMLNPIENAWSVLKSQLKQRGAERYQELVRGDPAGIIPKTEWRLRIMEQLIDQGRHSITPIMCLRFINHLQTFFPAAMNLQDMQLGR